MYALVGKVLQQARLSAYAVTGQPGIDHITDLIRKTCHKVSGFADYGERPPSGGNLACAQAVAEGP